MAKHLWRDLENLKKELFVIATLVEEAMNKAITALVERRSALAEEVLEGDDHIDTKEVQVEEECLKILALHQPVAVDLRFIIATMKVTNDLERMGDLSVNIAARAAHLANHSPLNVTLDFPRMADRVRTMVRRSLDALVELDADTAREVIAMDDEVDDANRKMFTSLQKLMHEEPATIERAVHTLSASRHLERIADLATNIAEDIVYMVEGELIRHRADAEGKMAVRL